ncbi:unnamed protein product [Ranitomeya imitator]|uniref:Uncharacterized protein n=1 Tax=Ranitomeya imitator TaxID=111125 RepID=A0ABN9KSD4_9NEOB|nr:unnamed protein product [Ranitomeya imitator]
MTEETGAHRVRIDGGDGRLTGHNAVFCILNYRRRSRFRRHHPRWQQVGAGCCTLHRPPDTLRSSRLTQGVVLYVDRCPESSG